MKRCFLLSLPLLIIVENYLVKTQIFHMTFLTGGGATEINSSTTDIPNFSLRALLNIFGYNTGPDYLSGKNAHVLADKVTLKHRYCVQACCCCCSHFPTLFSFRS